MQNPGSYAIAPFQSAGLSAGPFSHPRYTIRRPFFSFLGRKFHVFAPDGSLVAFVKHPVFKLRQEFSVYTDETERVPLLLIRARQLIGLNLCYDICDSSGTKLGVFRSHGLASIVHDTWDILGPDDQPMGTFTEDSLSLLRRFLPILLGHWDMKLGGQTVAKVDQVFRFFVKEFTLDVSMAGGRSDTRLALAGAMLALMREIARER